MNNPKIVFVKKSIEGEETEEVWVYLKDIRYPSIDNEIHLTRETAELLLAKLSAKLSDYPY